MTELMNVHLEASGKVLDFCLTYDADFIADRNTRTVLERNQCEPEVVHLLARTLRPGDIAVDGGANIGVFSIIMSKLVGPSGRVLAFEPGSNNFAKLEANIAQNKLTNIQVITRPLWEKEERVMVHLAHDSGNNALYPHAGTLGSYKAEATTLAAHLRRKFPKLIKLDVEGVEYQVLKGYQNFLGYVPYIVCELNEKALERGGSSIKQVREFMDRRQVGTFILHPDGSLPTLIPSQTVLRSDKPNLNILFATVPAVATAWPEIELR